MSHLSSGRVNLGILRETYRRELLECIDKCTGSKALVWDEALTGPVGLIAEYPLLKEHEVDKMFPLSSGRLPQSSVQNIIFITRPKLALMNVIAENVRKEDQSGSFRKEFHVVFVPKKSLLCERKLKELGVYGNFNIIDEFSMELIPVESDVLTLESESSFKECILENDSTSMYYAAKALMTLQSLYGIIPSIHGKGELSRHVCDMILRMRREMAGSEPQITPQIDTLFLVDRTVDPLTPLLTQLTYEGLIDETFGINNTTIKVPPEKFAKQEGQAMAEVPTEPKKIRLNSAEELFAEIRDKNFNAVGPVLSRKAKLISAQYNERHQAKSVSQMKEFVSKLPHMQQAKQSLSTHTSIAELVKEVTDDDQFMENLRAQQDFVNGLETDKAHPYIDDCIAKEEPLIKVLRLMCVQCYCNNGFKPKVLEYYKREIIQTYGYQHILTLNNLEKAGLLRQQGQRTYPVIKKSLRLVVDEVNEQNPNDIAYVFSGYAPLSVRLAQILTRPGWRSITEVLQMLPGSTFEEIQQIPVGLRKRKASITSTHSNTMDQKVVLIFFLGGVTYAEIAALRFLSQQEDGPADYIIATTKLINGKTWLEAIMENVVPEEGNPFLM